MLELNRPETVKRKIITHLSPGFTSIRFPLPVQNGWVSQAAPGAEFLYGQSAAQDYAVNGGEGMRSNDVSTAEEGLRKLDREIAVARTCTIGGLLLLPSIYFGWFAFNGSIVSTDSGDWGTLGDFVGGLLNPGIAALALYWLTRSVRLQTEELRETREALQESASAQELQVRLAAITALIQRHNFRIEADSKRLATLNQDIDDLLAHYQKISYVEVDDPVLAKRRELRDRLAFEIHLRETDVVDLEANIRGILSDVTPPDQSAAPSA